MGTRSNIQVEIAPGKTLAIYAHWDGYPSHMGQHLLNHFNTQELAEGIVRRGDMSSIGQTIDDCVFYKRDREEDGPHIEPHEIKTFEISSKKQGQEWQYQFVDGKWHVGKHVHPTGQKWLELTQEIVDNNGEEFY